ncbi:MAG: hypothetical protein CL670_14790 [Balneola sp.]|nr:hypothetical protein [Balneola sp.]MBE80423.1 hypothetical protein [Balneola sp.]|tara:strand:- start:450 stop:716 length:267 start_codon:yes stop_codon:yes gene_type:complete
MEEQPHESGNPFDKLPKCGAKTRSGTPCKRPGTKRNGRCRLHGGAEGVGAPKGNQNAFKHGLYTKESIAFRKRIRKLAKSTDNLLSNL